MSAARKLFKNNKTIPVVSIDSEEDAIALAEALLAGGINIVEITLRTSAGIKAIRRLSESKIIVGAGTVTTPALLEDSLNAGAEFIVTPGLTPELAKTAKSCAVPFIPGAITSSEVMLAREYGFDLLKFFPAEASGGIKTLKALRGVFSDIKFCPTGGINFNNYKEYLSLPNVFAVGGSWIASKEDINSKDWGQITQNSKKSTEKLFKI